jgi:uncharacterized protein (DUF362 family)
MPAKVLVEVLGADPPCSRCHNTHKVVEAAAEMLREEGYAVQIEYKPIMSPAVVSKYGALVSPAVAVNGVVRIMGSVPSAKQMESLIRKAT